MITPLIIAYIVISVMVTLFAIGRRISFAGAFFTSVFLSPIVGLIAILKTDKNIVVSHYTTRYVCPECNIEYTEEKDHCSFCQEMGKETTLVPKRVIMTD